MTKYRKKPVIIEAVQWKGGNPFEILDFIEGSDRAVDMQEGCDFFKIKTLEGDMTVSPSDYIIKGIQGEIYPCKPDIFKDTYEEVE